jgi:hypothetical protein
MKPVSTTDLEHCHVLHECLSARRPDARQVWFPPGNYRINTTVAVLSGMTLAGTAGAGLGESPSATLWGPADNRSPILLLNGTLNVVLRNLQLEGGGIAVHIFDAAGVRFDGVGVSASVNVDNVDSSASGCASDNCNVRLGSMNAAMVIADEGGAVIPPHPAGFI